MSTALPQRFRTKTWFTPGQLARASSTFAFNGTTLPRRHPPSAVITATACESSRRSLMDAAEKPPKTTECTAPMRAQASIAATASGTIGM